MGITVKSRPNHYELLGLTPAASSEEVAQAFAEQLDPLRPRAFGSLAEVTIAFETLRDRAKREAYDIAHGLKPEPTPPAPEVPAEWAPFLIRASAQARPPKSVPARPSEPRAEVAPLSEPSAESKISPFESARREPIRLPTHEGHLDPFPTADELRPPEARAGHAFEPKTGGDRLHFAETGRFRIEGDAPFQWKLPALAAGAMILAVGIGAWTGLESGNDSEEAQSAQAATVRIPPARPLPVLADSLPAAAPEAVEPQQRTQALPAVPQNPRQPPPLNITFSDEPAEAMAERPEVAAEQSVAEASTVASTPASLPLPNSVVARTIGRIGYPCGQVATASALGGGAFKVTCTSGHSYRAAPVRGRYRFRRM